MELFLANLVNPPVMEIPQSPMEIPPSTQVYLSLASFPNISKLIPIVI